MRFPTQRRFARVNLLRKLTERDAFVIFKLSNRLARNQPFGKAEIGVVFQPLPRTGQQTVFTNARTTDNKNK